MIPLGDADRRPFVPAILLVGLWFLTQVFSEVGALLEMQKGGVAYIAHVGGFILGWSRRGFSRADDGVPNKGWSRDADPTRQWSEIWIQHTGII